MRPSDYNQALADYICEQVSAGASLVKLCANEGLPMHQTVWRWRRQHPAFDEAYTRAVMERALSHGEEIIAIADDASRDYTTRVDKQGNEYQAVDRDNISRSKLMVEARQWYLSKLVPQYNDKLALLHSGTVGVVHEMDFTGMSQDDDDEDSQAD